MKNKIVMLLMFVAITAINVYSIRYYTNKNSSESVNIKLDVSEFSQIEAKIDALYEECKLRDSAIYRAVLEMREIITGLQTINERNSIAEL